MNKKISLFMRKLKKMPDFHRVKFVILFGSQINGCANKMSDYDFAVYYEGDKNERFKFRTGILGNLSGNYDVQTFQDLPLYVQKEVLKGKIIYSGDLQFVYDTAYEIIKKYSYFEKYYKDYIKMRKRMIWQKKR